SAAKPIAFWCPRIRAMTNYRRNFVPGGSYFFTVNLVDRRSRLIIENIGLLHSAFRYTRKRHPFTIDAIVVLPDHLHTIWSLHENDCDFALRWRLIKSAFSRDCRPESPFRKAVPPGASVGSGNDATGSTRCATSVILSATSTTSTSIRSSTAT